MNEQEFRAAFEGPSDQPLREFTVERIHPRLMTTMFHAGRRGGKASEMQALKAAAALIGKTEMNAEIAMHERKARRELDRVLSVACLPEKDRAGVRATERMREVLDLGGPRWAWGKR